MSEFKDTNPKDAVGIKKSPLSTVPMPFLFALGNAMLEGARKYGRHNYRAAGVRSSVYVDAIMRHIAAYWEGQDVDPDSGEHHLVKIAACCAVLFDSIMRNNYIDDRPPQYHHDWIKKFNERAADIVDKYPDPPDPWTEKRMTEDVRNSTVRSRIYRDHDDLYHSGAPGGSLTASILYPDSEEIKDSVVRGDGVPDNGDTMGNAPFKSPF